MEVKLLRVVERHKSLMLAVHKQIKLKEAASQFGFFPRHTKIVSKGLRETRGDFSCLLFRRQRPP